MSVLVAPSYLGVDPERVDEFLRIIRQYGAEYVHADIGDGEFIDEKTDQGFLDQLSRQARSLIIDFHLMVDFPMVCLDTIVKKLFPFPPSSPIASVHFEAEHFKPSIFEWIKSLRMRPGLAIKPETQIEEIKHLLKYVFLVNVMTVEPGKSGQAMIISCLQKVKELVLIREQLGLEFAIQVDGGINEVTGPLAVNAGANILVSGGYVMADIRRIQQLQSLEKKES